MAAARDRILAFDVNETLLDLRALDPVFERVLGAASLRPAWFATMLQVAFVGGLTGRYVDFSTAQRAALSMTATRVGRDLDDAATEEVVGAMRRLPAHPEVPAALTRLREAGFRLAALSNGVLDVVEDQLRAAGLREHFAQVRSADEVHALKPMPSPYRLVADRFGVPPERVRLVAAHGWDVSGALAAGCAAAFVARPGTALIPLGPRPDVVGADLAEVADRIVEVDG